MDTAPDTTSRADVSPVTPRQFLTFHLGDEEYALEIERVQEIKGFSPVTPLPNSPPYMRGVLNLRGVIVPVLDLRRRLGLAPIPYTRRNAIIVVVLDARLVGVVVDDVSDVVDLAPGDVQPPPPGAVESGGFVRGLARVGDRMMIQVDIERVVAFGDGLS